VLAAAESLLLTAADSTVTLHAEVDCRLFVVTLIPLGDPA